MPSLMLRRLAPDLVRQVRAYAHDRGLETSEAASELLTQALQSRQERTRGADVVNARLTPDERSARARKAAQARHHPDQQK